MQLYYKFLFQHINLNTIPPKGLKVYHLIEHCKILRIIKQWREIFLFIKDLDTCGSDIHSQYVRRWLCLVCLTNTRGLKSHKLLSYIRKETRSKVKNMGCDTHFTVLQITAEALHPPNSPWKPPIINSIFNGYFSMSSHFLQRTYIVQ